MPITSTMSRANARRLAEIASTAAAALETPNPFHSTPETNLGLLELAQARRVARVCAAAQAEAAQPARLHEVPMPRNLPADVATALARERAANQATVAAAHERYMQQLQRLNDAWGALTETLYTQRASEPQRAAA